MSIRRLLGIRYPILAGPMRGITLAPFTAAVSEAGALGCLAAAGIDRKEAFQEQVRDIRRRTGAPFAVNIAWVAPGAESILEWCLEERIEAVVSSAGMPVPGVARLKEAGVKVLQLVANVAQARNAEALGADAVIAKGWESGGLNALQAVATMPLVPQVVDAVSLPVIAAGGIGDGRGLAAALALGAQGALMGTRLLVARECPIHEGYKKALIAADDLGSRSISFPRFSARFLESAGLGVLAGGELDWRRLRPLDEECPDDEMILGAGQIVGLIREQSSVREIIEQVVEEFRNAAASMGRMRI